MTALHLENDRGLIPRIDDVVAAIEAGGYDGIWIGEVNNLDAVVPATLAAHASTRADIGVLLNVYTRGRATLAQTAATLADVAPGRMHIVLGVASPLLVQRFNAIPYERPFARLRDTLRYLRAVFDGGRIDGFSLPQQPAQPPKLLIAATGPRARALAAEEADGVVLNWLAPREIPQDVWAVMPVCPTDDRATVEAIMRPIVGDYLNAPAYAAQQRTLGRGEALAPMWDAWARGDRAGAHAALPWSVLDDLVIWGTPAECRRRLAELEATSGARVIATYFPPEGVDFLVPATQA